MNRIPQLLLVPLLCAAGTAAPASAAPPGVGERHADFTLPNIADGKAASLSEFRGKKLLLIQFASW